jgi:hypothetical protein
VPVAVSNSIKEIGASMVYTSIVLFAGFIIFAGSNHRIGQTDIHYPADRHVH